MSAAVGGMNGGGSPAIEGDIEMGDIETGNARRAENPLVEELSREIVSESTKTSYVASFLAFMVYLLATTPALISATFLRMFPTTGTGSARQWTGAVKKRIREHLKKAPTEPAPLVWSAVMPGDLLGK
jgi:hypothetical protein